MWLAQQKSAAPPQERPVPSAASTAGAEADAEAKARAELKAKGERNAQELYERRVRAAEQKVKLTVMR